MANISIKKGSYANKANLEDGDIGFAKYNSNTGTFIVNDGGTLVNLMPAPGASNKPLIGQGTSSAPTYKTLPVAGGGTGRTTLPSGKALIGSGTSAVSFRSITNNTTTTYISANTNLITANTLAYWNGAYSSTGSSRITKVGTIDKGTWNATPIAIEYGGTGATTAAAARTNLETAYCQIKTSTLPGTIGWYRIAQGDGLSNGTFEIKASVSYHHSVTTLIAGSSYTGNPSIQQLAHNAYPGGTGISKARIVYGGDKAYLEVYQPHAVQKTITVKITEGFGWTSINPEPISSIPSDYSSNEIILDTGKIISPTYESYLTWGGKNFAASFGPIDAALNPELGSNRLAYGHPNGIAVEYSRDGGATWIDYEMHPTNKVRLITPGLGSVVMVAGKGDSTANGNIAGNQNYQSRITLSSASLPLYTALNKFIILASTSGFANCWCTIEKKVSTTWTVIADKVGISGWSGYNVINVPNTVFGTGSGQASEIRLTFGGTGQTAQSKYAGLGIYSIAAFGGVGWTTPSTLAKMGRIYSLDATTTLDSTGKPIPIVTFPSQVKISDTTAPVNTATGALVVSGGAGIGGDIRIAGNTVVAGKIVAGANGTAATTNKLTIYGQSQFNGNAAITGTLNVGSTSQFGNVITLHNSSDAAKQKITTTAGAMQLSSASTLYLDSGSGSSLIFRPQGTEQARFNASGQLELKSTGAANATIIGPGTAGTFYFPNTGGTFVTHAARGTAVGSATTAPVYIASTGQATAITSVDIAHGGTNATTAAAARTNLGVPPISHAVSATTYGASSADNYGHAKASTTTPKANGTAYAGKETSSFARGDHIHPLQTTISGNAGSATKVNNNLKIQLNGGTSEGSSQFTFNGSAAKTINITPANIGADPKGSINRTFSTAPIYSYSSGVLIDFNMNEKSGFMIVVKIYGNSYDKDKSPIEAIYQFYDLSGGAINNTYCGIAISGPSIPLRVYRISGKLKAWFQQPTSYCTFRVEVFYGNNSGGNIPNITLSNAVAPTQEISQTITITPKKVYAGASDMADNMLLTKSGLDMIATNNYVANGKLAIGSASAPSENLYVNGTGKITGATTVKTLTISDTTGVGHLSFSRTGAPNYVVAPDKIAFNVGSSLSLETCALVVASNYVVPGVSKYSTLGTESNLWKGVYAANVRANSFDAKGIQENQIRVWHSESETDALYLFGNQDGRRGLFDMDIGSIISIGPDYVNFNSYRSAGSQWARGREVAPFRSTFVPDRTFNDYSAFFPIFSRKTKLGSWEAGCLMPGSNTVDANGTYNAGDLPSAEHNKLFYEAFHFVHTYDDTYTSNTHTVPLRIFGNGLVRAQKLGVTAAGGYGTGNPPTGTAGDPLFVGQLYFKIIE